MTNRIHPFAVQRVIEDRFSEIIDKNNVGSRSTNFGTYRDYEHETLVRAWVNTRDYNILNDLFLPRCQKYLTQHDRNTPLLFIEKEIAWAKEYQTYFPHWKTIDSQKTYYFILQDWIDFLERKATEQSLLANNSIAMELIGLVGGHNRFDTVQPVFHYIKDVMKKHNLSPNEAKELVNDFRGSVSPTWNTNVIPHIIEYLKNVSPSPHNSGLLYYSYYYNGKEKESDYQLRITKNKFSTGVLIPPTNEDLFTQLCMLLYDNKDPLFDEASCLEYHYTNCPLPQDHFLKYTRRMYLDFIGRKKPLSDLDNDIHGNIMNWFESKKTGNNSATSVQSFSHIFETPDWEKYIDALTVCQPVLLKKTGKDYVFVGNKKTQKGCVARWFKFLKSKGIIKQSVNRDELASVLSAEIKDYQISGATVDNESTTYSQTFEKQLTDYFDTIT